MVTAVAGFADSRTYEFVYSTAGHPPPLLLEPGRGPRLLACGGLPLGILSANYSTYRVQTVPGAMLVLYTDGAVEHSRNVIEGEKLLLEAAAQAVDRRDADAATVIHNAIFQGRPVGDDVAILTIGFADDAASGLRISADSAQQAFTGRLAAKRAESDGNRIVNSNSLAVIRLEGELEISRREEIYAALHLEGSERGVLLDFSDVTYADSTSLAELLRFRTEADRHHVPVAVVIGSKQFARLIQYAGLGDAFAIFEERSAALNYLASPRPA